MRKRKILLVNPWIADFAAYDLWAKPLGLLYIAKFLKKYGYELALIDLTDRARWGGSNAGQRDDGRGKLRKTIIPKPESLVRIPRRYGLYGATIEQFTEALRQNADCKAVLVTSHMTYWYPGLRRTVDLIREYLPTAKVILGGTYATIYPEHAAQAIEADYLITGYGEKKVLTLLDSLFGIERDYTGVPDFDDCGILPWELYDGLESVPVLSSRGCPFHCSYCATQQLNPDFRQREPEDVLHEITSIYETFGVRHFAFYDDALLANQEEHIVPILEGIAASGVEASFHTPNGLFAREINENLAALMLRAGVKTIRLSLESVVPKWQKASSNKTNNRNFIDALQHLRRAGYRSGNIEVYLIFGLPGQTYADVRQSLEFVREYGAIARLAAFSPIPGTADWERAREMGHVFDGMDPIYANKTLFPCAGPDLTADKVTELKLLCNTLNAEIQGPPDGR